MSNEALKSNSFPTFIYFLLNFLPCYICISIEEEIKRVKRRESYHRVSTVGLSYKSNKVSSHIHTSLPSPNNQSSPSAQPNFSFPLVFLKTLFSISQYLQTSRFKKLQEDVFHVGLFWWHRSDRNRHGFLEHCSVSRDGSTVPWEDS